MPNNTTCHQNIVLAALARVGIQVWNSGPKIASLIFCGSFASF